MEYINIIKNAFGYTVNDTTKFIKLAIPNLIIGLMIHITLLSFISAYDTYNYYDVMSAIVGAGILTIITLILGIIILIIDFGIITSVIKETLKGDYLPEFKIANFFVDGLKSFIIYIVYNIIPSIIFLIFVGMAFSADSVGLFRIGYLIYAILSFIVSLLMPVALGRFAETNSITEALSIGNIWEITKKIGIIEIFVMLFLLAILMEIISFIAVLLFVIPLIGAIIGALIITFVIVVIGRTYGLIYIEQNNNGNYYQFNNQGYPQNQQFNNQGHPQNQNTLNNKICSNCGHQNEINALHCIKCGNSLQNESISNSRNIVPNNSEFVQCPHCGSENSKDATFCIKCGTTLTDSFNNKNFCKNCGSLLEDNAVFCDNCGTKNL